MCGGATLAATACAGGEPTGLTTPTPEPLDDAATLRVLMTAEHLAMDLYGRALREPGFDAERRAYLRSVLDNERAHHAALVAVGGIPPPRSPRFDYPEGAFDGPLAVARIAAALEEAFVGAYLGALSELGSAGLRAVVVRIAACEAQHLAAAATLLSRHPGPVPSLPSVTTVREAAEAVAGFLA